MIAFKCQPLQHAIGCFLYIIMLCGCQTNMSIPTIDKQALASKYFEEDANWYVDNVPFFECSDTAIEQVYYYRWKLYKAHLRSVGQNEWVVTEFINHVAWDRDPHCTINAASMHHIYEGQWLRDDRYIDGYINYLFQHGGNNRSYSESVADAAYKRYLVNADSVFLAAQLDSMIGIFEKWIDHWDSSKYMYYIPAMPDATEYTIASIDASGGTAGFDGGDAFRPTINSYMYANALAISKIAAMKGDQNTSDIYLQKANDLKQRVEQHLWNDSLQHFTDRFKQDNQYVHYWDFIRGRELAGMIPWNFDLPSNKPEYSKAWQHVVDTNYLLGKYGFRTNEPSYEHYFKQFVYYQGQRGSQWNGPSWPYQSSLVLTAMANLLNNYHQDIVTTTDYLKLLRLYTHQHYLPDGKINLVENYDPNLGGPIVYYYWSNHYNHSSYNNLVIAGLCGIRPSDSDSLTLNPLIDSSISYFMLDGIRYHGHELVLSYDRDGTKYNNGKGLNLWVDGKKAKLAKSGNHFTAFIGKVIRNKPVKDPVNHALNIRKTGFPQAAASVNNEADSLNQAIDGRTWYFPEITNYWTTVGSKADTDWYALDFGQTINLSSIKICFFANKNNKSLPDNLSIEYMEKDGSWKALRINTGKSLQLKANTENVFSFDKILTRKIRLVFHHAGKQIAVGEIACY